MKPKRFYRGDETSAVAANVRDPEQVLMDMLSGLQFAAMMSAATRLGIPDHLEAGPKSLSQLAALVRANESALRRLMRGCATIGLVEECKDGRFAMTNIKLLCASRESWMREGAIAQFDEWHIRSYGEAERSVSDGEAGTVEDFR